MPKNLALSFVITANTAAAVQQVQALQRLIQAATGVTPAANPFGAVQSGADASGQSIGLMVAKYASAAAAIAAVGAAFKAGLNTNAETESSTLGIKALVAAMTTVKDASGAVVTDLDKRLVISGSIAEDEVKKLRIAGLQTAATFQQLLSAFQQGIGAGASAGLSLEEIRGLTIGITQAAAALGMPMNMLNQEVRSLLSGNIDRNSTVATALGITGAQVKQWREAGTMAENLNKRLEAFVRLGPEAGKTWTATLSNVGDAFSLLLGEMSKGSFDKLKTSLQDVLAEVFDIKNVGIAEAFQGLAAAGATAFDGIGTVLNDALMGGVEAAKELSTWFVKHADEVLVLGHTFGVVYDNIKGVVSSIVSAIAAVTGLGVETGVVNGVFATIAMVVALIQDGFQLWKGVLADVGAYILDKVGGPLRTVLGSLRDFLSQIPGIGTSLAAAVDGVLRAIPASGEGLHKLAAGIQADFDAGRTAVARTNAELAKTAQQLRKAKLEKPTTPGGTSLGKKPPPDDDGSAKKAAEAYATALRAYAAAESEAQKKISQSLKAVAEADLEKSLQARLISQEGYLRKKAALEQKALAEEIATARQQATLLASDAAAEGDPAKKKKLEANLVKVRAEITALENKGLVINTKLAIDLEAFRREVESLSIDIKANILDMEGNPLGGSLAKLQKETQDLLKDPRVRDDPELKAAVNQQAQLKEARLQFDEQKRLSDNRVAFMSLAEEQIALKVQTGQMTALEGERAVRQARLDAADAILTQVKALEALAKANPKNDEMALAAQRARLEFDKLKTTMNALATEFNRGAADAVGSAIESWTSGALRFGDAIKKVFADVFGNVAKRFLKEFTDNLFKTMEGKDGQGIGGALAGLFSKDGGIGKMFSSLIDSLGNMFSSLVGSLSGAGGGGGGWGALISSIGSAVGFDEGGFTGHGGKYQAAGIVHRGEYVFTKAEVQKAGLPFFYGLKNQIKGGRRMPGYAEGGFVGGGMAGVAAAMPAPVFSNYNTNQNNMYLDPDDAARHIGRSPVMGREIARVVFQDNASKFNR